MPSKQLNTDEISDTFELFMAIGTIFDRTGDVDYINGAIEKAECLVAAFPDGNPLRPPMLTALGSLLHKRSISFQEVHEEAPALTDILVASPLADLERVIEIISEALAATQTEDAGRANRLQFLSHLFHDRFKRLGVIDDLHNAIRAMEQAAATSHSTDPKLLIRLGLLISDRFTRLQAPEDLDKAISTIAECVAATPSDDTGRARMLRSLGILFFTRYVRLVVLDDLHNSILAMEEADLTAPSTDPTTSTYMGYMLGARFVQLDTLEDLDKAIAIITDSLAATASDDRGRATILLALSIFVYLRFTWLGTLDDLDNAILGMQEVAMKFPSYDAEHSNLLRHMLYDRMGNSTDHGKAIQSTNEALAGTSSDDPDRVPLLLNLSGALFSSLQQQVDLEDLQAAIGAAEEAVVMASPDSLYRMQGLRQLGKLLHIRYQWLGAPEDHINAIQAAKDVVAASLVPVNRSSRVNDVLELSAMLDTRQAPVGWSWKNDQSILMVEKVLATSSPEHRIHARVLDSLSTIFRRRFRCLGALPDLEKSIKLGERAVAANLPGDHERAWNTYNLSTGYMARFLRLGSEPDLILSLQMATDALEGFPTVHTYHAIVLNHIAMLLFTGFTLSGNRRDIDSAIAWSERAVAAIPEGHLCQKAFLSNLGSFLHIRFTTFKEPSDLEKGIQMANEGVGVYLPNEPVRSKHLMELGNLLHARHTESRSPMVDDIAGAPGVNSGQAIALLPLCLDACLATWNCPLTPSMVRIEAAFLAVGILVRDSSWEYASSLVADAVKQLPTIVPQFLAREDQENRLSAVTNLASSTMSLALQAGDTPAHCLSLLELGRGIIMSFSIDCRSDLSELRAQQPEFFNTLNRLRIEIDAPLRMIQDDSGDPTKMDSRRRQGEDRLRRRVHALEELDETLAHIHQLPGFERFQRPPSPGDLMAMAVEGPIVICNCNKLRSDAIIVTATAIKGLSLPGLVFSEITDHISQFTRLVRGTRSTAPQRNMDMAKALIWLWEVTVEPIFEELGIGAAMEPELADSKLPRIWWIGVGILARAPFHAAGDHSRGSTRNTLSRAISSYIPTIKALSYARQKKLELDTEPRLLLVAMPTTPDTPAIPEVPATCGTPAIAATPPIPATATTAAVPRTQGTPAIYSIGSIPGTPAKKWKPLKSALKEIHQIVAVIRQRSATVEVGFDNESTAPVLILQSPSVNRVIEKLPAYQIIHFACHGVSNGKTPSNSHLVLLGDRSSEPGKLTVAAIASMNIEKAQIAYLSACSTADNASIPLADESIHIASGFQLAGFSHVLATLWSANDQACQQVAVDFYRLLLNGELKGVAGHRAVSTAFHRAVKKLRDDNLRLPTIWACFIHTGA